MKKLENQKRQIEITHFYHIQKNNTGDDFDIFYSGGYIPNGKKWTDDNFSSIACYKILQLLVDEVDFKNLPFEYVHLKTGERALVALTIDDDVVLIQDDGPEMMIMIFEGQHQLQKVVLPLFKHGNLDEQIIKHQQKEIKVRQV